jgi:hypothetical protein
VILQDREDLLLDRARHHDRIGGQRQRGAPAPERKREK